MKEYWDDDDSVLNKELDDYKQSDKKIDLNISHDSFLSDDEDENSIIDKKTDKSRIINNRSTIMNGSDVDSRFTPIQDKFAEDDSELEELKEHETREQKKQAKESRAKDYKTYEFDEKYLEEHMTSFWEDKELEDELEDEDEREKYNIHIEELKRRRDEKEQEQEEKYQQRLKKFREKHELRNQRIRNEKIIQIQKQLEEDKKLREEYEKNTPPVQKLTDIFEQNKNVIPDPAFDPVKSFIREDAPKLYLAATKEDALAKDKIAWAVYCMGIHTRLNTFLSDVQKNNPEKLASDDRIAAMNTAYGLNSGLCAEAIAAVPDQVIQGMVDQAYEEAKNNFILAGGPNGKEYQTRIARILYLGKLKYEYENVHGTPEQVKAWKEEILTELLSDKFDENVEKYKDSEIFNAVIAEIKREENRYGCTLEEIIQKALVRKADEKYHNLYSSYFADGVKTEQEKEEVLKVTASLDEMKALANTVGIQRKGGKNTVDTEFHPSFDTQFIKKRANLYGKQENFVGKLRQKEYDEFNLKSAIEREVRRAKNAFEERYRQAKKNLETNKIHKDLLKLEKLNAEITRINNRILELSSEPDLTSGNELDPVLTFASMKQSVQEEKDLLLEEMKKYKPEDITAVKKEQDDLKKAEAGYEEDLAKLLANTEAKVREDFEVKIKGREKKEADEIREEAQKYKAAVENNDENEIRKIKEIRVLRDEKYKENNGELYKEHTCKRKEGNSNYYSLESVEALAGMKNGYISFKKTLAIENEKELDTKFDESIKKYEETQEKYNQKPLIPKPDRSTQKINAFNAPDVQKELNFDEVDIDWELNAYHEPVAAQEGLPIGGDNHKAQIGATLKVLAAYKDVGFFNSKEYNAFYDGLKDLEEKIASGQDEKTVIIPNCRKLLMMMNHYTDRKDDELNANGRERESSKSRRIATEFAKAQMNQVIYTLCKKNRVKDSDYVYSDILAEMEHVNRLTKSKDREFNEIMEHLREQDMKQSIDKMNAYLAKRVSRYKGANGLYPFKLDANDPNQARNIPETSAERLYKTVVLGLEKMERRYLESTLEKEPDMFPKRQFLAKYYGSRVVENNTVDSIFNTRVNPAAYELNLKIKKKENLIQYSNEFAMHYRAYINKMKFDNVEIRKFSNGFYNPQNLLSSNKMDYMLECAFSAKFLSELSDQAKKKGIELNDFDFEKTEEERLKFLTVVKESGLLETIKSELPKEFDLTNVNGDDRVLLEKSTEAWEKVKNPSKMIEKVVLPAIKNEIIKNFKSIMEKMARKTHEVSREGLRQNIRALEANVKLAKSLGLSRQMDVLNNQIVDLFRGETLRESVDNLKKAVHEKFFAKPIAPIPGVRI